MNNRISLIRDILKQHPNSFFVLSNGLTSREAAHFLPSPQCFYMLHAMGEALSVGIGLSHSRPDLSIVVIDGDYNALMGLASWALMPRENVKYYVLENGISETTGGEAIPRLPFVPEWCTVLKIMPGKETTPNPPDPMKTLRKCQEWLMKTRDGVLNENC